MDKPIPPAVATRVASVLGDVMNELRALREIALSADDLASLDAFPLVTGAICERAYTLLDRCSVKLGGIYGGAFDLDARFAGDTGVETEAEHD